MREQGFYCIQGFMGGLSWDGLFVGIVLVLAGYFAVRRVLSLRKPLCAGGCPGCGGGCSCTPQRTIEKMDKDKMAH